MTAFRFAAPLWLILLLFLPLLAWLCGRRKPRPAIRFSSAALFRHSGFPLSSRAGAWLNRLRFLALALIILALARPQTGTRTTPLQASGIDIILAVDLSTSMWAHDFKINGRYTDRLRVVKQVMRDFINKRPSDRIGIVAFAGNAYTVSPLTLNHDWLLENNLERLQIGLIEDGTAIGTAIGISTNRLISQTAAEAQSRVMVLLTDGANNRGEISPAAAAEAAAALGVKIYTIGAGRSGRVPMPRLDPQTGKPRYDRSGNIVLVNRISDIDSDTLKNIAEISAGRFFRATDTESLEKIYDEIDVLEKTEVTLKQTIRYADSFAWLIFPALTLLIIEQILACTRLRILP